MKGMKLRQPTGAVTTLMFLAIGASLGLAAKTAYGAGRPTTTRS